MEYTSTVLGSYFGVGRLGLLQGELQGLGYERIQMAELRHSLDLMPSKLDGRYLSAGDKLSNLEKIEIVQFPVRHIQLKPSFMVPERRLRWSGS
jgi:hypothetical protein